MGTIKDEYYHLAASDDSDDNGLKYGYQSPIRYCHRIAPRHCPVGSLPASHIHIPAHCMSIRRKPCIRNHAADMLAYYRRIFFDILIVLARSLACLTHLPVTPSHHFHSDLLLEPPLKQPTRTDHGTTPTAKTPSEFLSQFRSNRGAERGFATLQPPR
jgi:hypothetical protein